MRRNHAAHQETIMDSAKLLTTEQAAQRLGLSVSTLNKRRISGEGPNFIKLGSAVRYLSADLEKFVEERRRRSTSQHAS